jgi:hypothetical protein
MAENWYLILGLEFDPPVEDIAKIEAKITEMMQTWSRNSNHMTKGPEARKYLKMANDKIIINALSIPEERKRQIKEACDLTYGALDKLLKMMRKTEISEDEISKVAAKQKVAADAVRRRAIALGMKIVVAKGADFQAVYDKYYKTRPQDAQKLSGMDPLLKTFATDNLYSFLFANTTIKKPADLPCDALRQKAAEKKKNEFYKPNDDIHSSGRKLCDHCEVTFKDDKAKDIYDKYLEYLRRKTVLDDIKTFADISGEITAEQGEGFIGQLTELFKDRKLSTEVLTAFCKIEKISYNTNAGATKSNDSLKVCRCGCTNDVSDGRKVCQSCGIDLFIKCPKCNAENDAHVKVCKCGFELENINKALALCELADGSIESMDFQVAEAHIADAERYWPDSSRVKALKIRLDEFKKRIGSAAESLRSAVSEGRYYEAQKQYVNIRKLFPDFSELDLEKEIKAAISASEQALRQAQESKAEKDIIDLCSKAYESCKDYPGIKELILKYPPATPVNLKVSIDGNTRMNSLSWDKSESVGSVFYSVVRKKDAVPVNVGDGELLGRVSMCGFNDAKITPATNYFYAVFAERAGVYSSALTSKSPAINLFEIANVTVAAGDALLQLEWDTLPSGATVEIFRRSDSGKEEKLNSTTSTSYLDSGLVNDKLYHYVIKLTYNVNGQRQQTNGVTISGIPTKPPKAIESLIVKPAEGDNFTATWDNPDSVDVELYCSTEKPTYNFGDLIAQSTLETKMRRLALNKSSSCSATFQHRGEELLYIVAVVIKSGSAIFGAMARASKGESVNIKNVAAVNEKINIYIDLPRDATGFVVLYRFDKFPEDISDIKTVRKYIPLKQYLHHSAIVLDTLEQKNYYFSVFAEFTRDGEKDYSVGADYLFSNAKKEVITYSISASKRLLGGNSVTLEFEAENKPFILPDIDIMSAIGNTPMFKASAKLFYSIASQTVNGSHQVTIPIPKGTGKDTYIKAFLKDEKQASTYQLKLKVKSNYQIT